MSNSTIYHAAYSERNVGRTQPENKREVTFKFAVVDEEQKQKDYKVVLKWSFTSGKQSICINDHENYFFKDTASLIKLNRKIKTHDGMRLHIVGVHSPPHGCYNYVRLFDMIIDERALFSSTPFIGGGRSKKVNHMENSVLDLIHPGHPLGRNPSKQQQARPADGNFSYDVPTPPKPVEEAPDLLLDFDPIPSPAPTAPAPVALTADTGMFNNPMAAAAPPPMAPPPPPPTVVYDPFGPAAHAADPYGSYPPAAVAASPFGAPPQHQQHQQQQQQPLNYFGASSPGMYPAQVMNAGQQAF